MFARSFKYYLRLVFERNTFIRALRISFLVGILLNLINNPGVLTLLSVEDIHPGRVLLTFLVPFGVSAYSSVLSSISARSGNHYPDKGNTECDQD